MGCHHMLTKNVTNALEVILQLCAALMQPQHLKCALVDWKLNSTPRDRLHRETMDFLRLSTALHSCQNILSEKEQRAFLCCQEVLLSLKDKLSRVVANYLVIEV